MAFPRKTVAALALLALFGCGGSDHVRNAAHARFFNAFADKTDVRAYFGTHLYAVHGVGPAVGYANDLAYDDVPSGTETINVNPYIDFNTVYASLASQSLFEGGAYTVVGLTPSTTRSLLLFSDTIVATTGSAYVRIINAAPTAGTVYATLKRQSDGLLAYNYTAFAVGVSTGYKSVAVADTTSVTYVLNVYRSSDFTNPISGNILVTLNESTPVTLILYDASNGNGQVLAKAAADTYHS